MDMNAPIPPPDSSNVQSVARAFALLESLNLRAVSSVEQLYQETGLPKPTIVRLLKTLIGCGYVTNDRRQGGYQVTVRVKSLSSGFHRDPLVVEAARPWAIALTRQLTWPVAIAMLERDAVAVRFSTIPDSPISPFHATLNRRLSLASSALGLAYLAFCPEEERTVLISMAQQSDKSFAGREAGWLDWRILRARETGFAERDPGVEPRNSGTIAVPIMSGNRVIATIGLTYFKVAVDDAKVAEEFAPILRDTARAIESQIITIGSAIAR